MKKVLLLYTSVGMGHKAIAENIAWHMEQDGYEVRLSDMAMVEPGLFAKIVIPVHQFINKYLPFIWGWLYRWGHYAILPLRVAIAGLNHRNTKILVNEYRPDMIITTQTTASAVVAYLKKKGFYRGLFGIAFSDYHWHRYWLYPGADFYLANIEEQRRAMLKLWRGKERTPIFICGMTLRPKPMVDAGEVRRRLGIGADERIVLMASGSLGTAMTLEWVRNLAGSIIKNTSIKYKVGIIILCGKNSNLFQQLQRSLRNPSIKIMEYYTPFAELCAISDIFLTKPGGLSVAEGLQWNLPMLITHWLPGQEAINYEYLRRNHLVMPGPDNVRSMKRQEIVTRIGREMETGEFRKSLFTNEVRLRLVQPDPPVPVAQAVKQMFHKGLTG